MDYTWEKLTSREFEIIACNFANDMFPSYKWELTDSTRDDNHDFYTETGIMNKWGEAKHSQKCNKTISRSQWDPTLVSAKLINSINDVLLVTCAYIPLSYVIRTFHMTVSPIDNVYCINRLILNEWYKKNHKNLSAFNSGFNIDSICNKIEVCSTNCSFHNEVQVYFFNDIAKNYLTILKNLLPNSKYMVNIVLFATDFEVDFKIDMGEYISIIDDIIIKNLSFINKKNKIERFSPKEFTCKISKGYSIITFSVFSSNILKDNLINHIKYSFGKSTYEKNISFEFQTNYEKMLLVDIEKSMIQNNRQNRIIKTAYIPPHLLNRPNFKFIYISFDERYNFNNAQLCRLFSYFLTGIDFQELEEISLKDNLYLCNYPESFENIILGIFCDFTSSDYLKNGLNSLDDLLLQNRTPENVIYIIENTFQLKEEQKKFLAKIELTFSSMQKNSHIIFQDNSKKLLKNDYNDDIALVGIFETGVKYQYLNIKNLEEKESLVVMDIDNSLYYPTINMDIINVKSFVLKKGNDDFEFFFNKVINIVSKQLWSSRVLDFVLLIEKHIPNTVYFKIVRRLRDIYYNRTDFNTAYQYSKILHDDINKSEEQYIDDIYKEADELNHCGSIIESREKFANVAEKIMKSDNTNYLKKGLEALTEVYNISFWLLDVENLEQKIDKTLVTYFGNINNDVCEDRDLYPYYNCLNRKMVVQYFLEHYTDAEKTFELNLEAVKLDNYIAFAYMDSARGLYNKDVHKAYERINIAITYLEKLLSQQKEVRRYYDCLIEKAYLEFILSNQNERTTLIKNLSNAVYNAKKHGYKSIVQKSYFKLAACFMVLGDIEHAKDYLQKIRNNPYFLENPRNQLMYNELMKGYYHLLNNDLYKHNKKNFRFCEAEIPIEFKCYASEKNKFFIETRLW